MEDEREPPAECAGMLRALRELYEPSASASAPPIMALALLHDLAKRSVTIEHTLAVEVLGRHRLAGELRRVMESAIVGLSLPGVHTSDNGHGTLVVHGLQKLSESEWSDTKHTRVGDAFQAEPNEEWVATESEERKDRLVASEDQIWAFEDRKPLSSRRKRICSTPGCDLNDGHIGPHSEEAARSRPKVKKFKIPDNRPTVYAHEVVGRRVAIFWPSEGKFFKGFVYEYDEFTDFHSVLYDDGDDNVECLCDPTTKWTLLV